MTQTQRMIATERLRREAERRRQAEAEVRAYMRGRASASTSSASSASSVPPNVVQRFLEEARAAYGREVARELERSEIHGPTVRAAAIVLERFMEEQYSARSPEDQMRLILSHELDIDAVRLSVRVPEKKYSSVVPRRVLRDAAF